MWENVARQTSDPADASTFVLTGATTETDANGEFRICRRATAQQRATGWFALTWAGAGFTHAQPRSFVHGQRDVTITLEEMATFSGRVAFPRGVRARDVTLELFYSTPRQDDRRPAAIGVPLDDDGHFAVERLAPTTASLVAVVTGTDGEAYRTIDGIRLVAGGSTSDSRLSPLTLSERRAESGPSRER